MAQASPLPNSLKRGRNLSTGGADVLRLDLDRRIVGDVPLIDSVVMKLDRATSFRRYGQLGRMKDVEAGADAAVAGRAKYIAREIQPNVPARLLLGVRHHRPIKRPAIERDLKAHWFLKDQCGANSMTAEIS
jgi:hypothetical protein